MSNNLKVKIKICKICAVGTLIIGELCIFHVEELLKDLEVFLIHGLLCVSGRHPFCIYHSKKFIYGDLNFP